MNKIDAVKLRMELILTQDDMDRIKYKEITGKKIEIIADVHGMSKPSAKRFIRNIIAIVMEEFFLLVIHGYNRGCAIKEMLRTETLSLRVSDLKDIDYNEGATMLTICAPA